MTEKNVWEWICMKNNKLFTILLMVALLVFTTACTKDEPEETVSEPDQNETQQIVEENYADEEFLNDFVKALVARWEYKPDFEYEEGSSDHFNYFTELVQIERDILNKYRNEKFQDAGLAELCNSYLDGLDQQDEALSYLMNNYDAFSGLWRTARDQRAICIKAIYDEVSGFTVPAEHEYGLYHMLTAAYISQNSDQVYSLLNSAIKNGDYKLEGSVLSFSILNTTGFEFRDYPIYADLYDNGTYVYYGIFELNSWKPNEVCDFVFALDPSIGFDTIEITVN